MPSFEQYSSCTENGCRSKETPKPCQSRFSPFPTYLCDTHDCHSLMGPECTCSLCIFNTCNKVAGGVTVWACHLTCMSESHPRSPGRKVTLLFFKKQKQKKNTCYRSDTSGPVRVLWEPQRRETTSCPPAARLPLLSHHVKPRAPFFLRSPPPPYGCTSGVGKRQWKRNSRGNFTRSAAPSPVVNSLHPIFTAKEGRLSSVSHSTLQS